MDKDAVSVCQNSIFERIYKNFIVRSIKENRKVEGQLGYRMSNFDKIYGMREIELDMDRMLTIRWFRIPTFIKNNRPRYYSVFLVDIGWWRAGELNLIWDKCRECSNFTDMKESDSYTIYLVGKLEGLITSVNKKARDHHIFRINKYLDELTEEFEEKFFDWIADFLDKRCLHIPDNTKNKLIFGMLEKDTRRISEFVSSLQNVNKIKNLKPDDMGVITAL